ncbi:hypothetical protein OBDJBBDK_00094 [Aeromonas phage AhFM11]|nr:hypothetical protein OBDJBBDK_00094 [Aeromonas phage AhFM11]
MKSFMEVSGRKKGKIDEDMVAGDSNGNPVDIAAGKTSGAITLTGPETLGKKKKKKDVQPV